MFDIIIGVILLIAAVFLVVSVLLQSSKTHKMPGTIAGGAETFFGKTKGNTIDRVLGKVTSVVAIVFCVLVVVMYVAQDQEDLSSLISNDSGVATDTAGQLAPDLGTDTETDADADGADSDAEGSDSEAEGSDTSAE